MANQVWDSRIAELQVLLDQVLIEGEKYVIPETVAAGFKAMAAESDNNRRVVTFGALDDVKIVPLCREGIVPWWLPFTGKACIGDAEALDRLKAAYTADLGKSDPPDMSSCLTWLSFANKIETYPVSAAPAVLARVTEWGGDVNSGDGKWLVFAAKFMAAESLEVLVNAGAAPQHMQRALEELAENKKTDQFNVVQDVLLGKTLHTKADDDTLLSVQYLPEGKGLSQLRLFFNFKAQRINEVFEMNSGHVAMSNAGFADYAPEALRIAEEKFMALGGRPPYGLDKQRWKLPKSLRL